MEAIEKKKRREELYFDYLKELDTLRTKPLMPDEKASQKAVDRYTASNACFWVDVLDEAGEISGFLVMGMHKTKRHRDSDYAIAEAYVIPEKRNCGLMTKAVEYFTQTHPGIYSMLVVMGNISAQHFWQSLFKKLGFTEITLSKEAVSDPEDDYVLLGFDDSSKFKG